jgi:hypothetical protein
MLFLAGAAGVTRYYFSPVYDVPFRVEGHYEKNVWLADRPFAISPDEKTILYATISTGHGDLWTMDVEGTIKSD